MSIVGLFGVKERELSEEFDQFFRSHYELVYRTAYGVTGTREDAEDVVQTIFLRLLGRELPPGLRKNPKAYLHRAAVNVSLNTIRFRRRHALAGDNRPPEVAAYPVESEPGEEMESRLWQAISELPEGAAEILILRYLHNQSLAEIASLLGTTRGTVAVSLFRTRTRLKKRIRQMEGEQS